MASVNARISAETDVDEPKALSVEVQPAPNGSVGDSDSDLLSADARPAAERRLVRQLDLRLMPTIIIIFIMNYIDVRLVASPVLVFVPNENPENSSDYSQVEGIGTRSWVNWSILIAVRHL